MILSFSPPSQVASTARSRPGVAPARSKTCASSGLPASSIMAFPGRRVEFMRAWIIAVTVGFMMLLSELSVPQLSGVKKLGVKN
jgi:hypothetical protein